MIVPDMFHLNQAKISIARVAGKLLVLVKNDVMLSLKQFIVSLPRANGFYLETLHCSEDRKEVVQVVV